MHVLQFCLSYWPQHSFVSNKKSIIAVTTTDIKTLFFAIFELEVDLIY